MYYFLMIDDDRNLIKVVIPDVINDNDAVKKAADSLMFEVQDNLLLSYGAGGIVSRYVYEDNRCVGVANFQWNSPEQEDFLNKLETSTIDHNKFDIFDNSCNCDTCSHKCDVDNKKDDEGTDLN